MKQSQTTYICSNCDAQSQKWIGRCLECGKWGTLQEQTEKIAKKNELEKNCPICETQKLNDIKNSGIERTKTNIEELNRVLGGGIVPGVVILLGGEPGIGKSTLSIQLANIIPNTLYISGEESLSQIKLRANRLGISSDTLELANETNAEKICATIRDKKPGLAIIDSIQTIYSDEAQGESGNTTQLKACAVKLLEVAKKNNIPIIIIGHVTKDGNVAGPKTLEHLVDTVLYLEGERYHTHRILRTIKNRFGSTDEVGVFEMTELGLKEIKNPSASFLEERGENMSGSVITCLMEGTRPILVEVQALVNKTNFGFPVRKASGFDLNRLHVLSAVLEKRTGMNLSQQDIHINIAGGIKANEPAADLAVCFAIASSFRDKILSPKLAVFAEVGLGGEIRKVSNLQKRIRECEQLGMEKIITKFSPKEIKENKIKIFNVKNLQDLIRHT